MEMAPEFNSGVARQNELRDLGTHIWRAIGGDECGVDLSDGLTNSAPPIRWPVPI